HQRRKVDSRAGRGMVRARASGVRRPVSYDGWSAASTRRGSPDDQAVVDSGAREFQRQAFQTGECELQSETSAKTASTDTGRRKRRKCRAGHRRETRADMEFIRYARG